MRRLSILFLLVFVAAFSSSIAQEDITVPEILGKQIPFGGEGNPYKLRTEVYDAFLEMQEAANKDGIEIRIASGYRSYMRQKFIWEKKFEKYKSEGLSNKEAAQKIIEYSTFPGTSRHHWGTDIDVIQKTPKMPTSLLNAENYGDDGVFCEMHEWLEKNASQFGFYLVYTDSQDRTGFSYEPWHYSYKFTSIKILKKAIALNAYENWLQKQKSGLHSDYIISHILGINPQLKSF